LVVFAAAGRGPGFTALVAGLAVFFGVAVAMFRHSFIEISYLHVCQTFKVKCRRAQFIQ
jgi:hypothetical protein